MDFCVVASDAASARGSLLSVAILAGMTTNTPMVIAARRMVPKS